MGPAGRARTVFFGSGRFGVPILEALVAAPEVELVGVVSVPDRPVGRSQTVTPTPVAARAVELGLPVLRPVRLRDPEAVAEIAALAPGLGVLADYGRIVPPAILDLPERGILNVHPSLLPRHRGATPIPAAILAGDAKTGVTLIRMDTGVDTGPRLAWESWPLDVTATAPELEERAATAGASLLRRSLAGWLDGSLDAHPQREAGASTTRPLRRADGRLDPTESATTLERQVRAYQPWPGSSVDTPVGRLGVWRATLARREEGDEPGTFVDHAGWPALVAADGRLVLAEVQPAGGRRMSGREFLRGRGRDVVARGTG